MVHAARALRMGVMLGCMLESGLGIAAGCCVAPLCDHVDLDGNLLLREDPWPGVELVDGVQVPSRRAGSRRLRPCVRRSSPRSRRSYGVHAVLRSGEGRSGGSSRSSTRRRAGRTRERWPPPRRRSSWVASPRRLAEIHKRRIEGRVRRCASQEGRALQACLDVGLRGDARLDTLAESLVETQWPDGGWNCDRHPHVTHSSFNETWGPILGLATRTERSRRSRARSRVPPRSTTSCSRTARASPRTRRSLKLHYPRVLALRRARRPANHRASVGLGDARASEPLDLLEAKRREDGTWRPEGKWWKRPGSKGSNVEVVDWGTAANELADRAGRGRAPRGRPALEASRFPTWDSDASSSSARASPTIRTTARRCAGSFATGPTPSSRSSTPRGWEPSTRGSRSSGRSTTRSHTSRPWRSSASRRRAGASRPPGASS